MLHRFSAGGAHHHPTGPTRTHGMTGVALYATKSPSCTHRCAASRTLCWKILAADPGGPLIKRSGWTNGRALRTSSCTPRCAASIFQQINNIGRRSYKKRSYNTVPLDSKINTPTIQMNLPFQFIPNQQCRDKRKRSTLCSLLH